MMIHISARSPVDVMRGDDLTTTTSAGDQLWSRQRVPMQLHMAWAAERHAIVNLVSRVDVGCVWEYVVGGESALELLAGATASLTPVAISLENGITPAQIPRVLEPFPRSPSLPVRVSGATQDGAAFKLCAARFCNRLGRHPSAASLVG
jgi:hypothetical protein